MTRAAWWCVAGVWAPVVALWAWSRTGWSQAVLMTLSGLCALGATWLLARAAREQEESVGALERSTRELAAELAPESSTSRSPGVNAARDDRLAGVSRELERIRERARESARSSAVALANLRAILEAIDEPVLTTDARGVVIASNPAAEALLAEGVESPAPRPVIGRALEDLFADPELLSRHAGALRGTAETVQVRYPRAGVTRVFLAHSAPVRLRREAGGGTAEERGAVLTLRDVTELARAVQLKTDFVANASHELRTPLSSIKAAAETLRDGGGEDPAMFERLTGMIGENVERLEDMVRDLLDLSRLESSEAPVSREVIEIVPLLESLRRTFEGVCRARKLTIEFDVTPGVERVESDPRLVQLILRNLLDNATKFAFEGTAVRVVVRPRADDPGTLRLRVVDRGIGIPFGHQQRIFERFYQVDAARTGQDLRRGTGLGLAIVKHAVRRLGGSVGVESVWRQGTTITVDLPASGVNTGGDVWSALAQ